MNIKIRHIKTEDDLRLQGVEYEPEKKDICVLLVHGMSGNFIENYFASVLGEELAKEQIGFIYGHNRGYSHVNDINTSELIEKGGYKSRRIGAMYEIFTDCLLDIEGWMKKCRELGYKRIILAGHSLGVPKVIHYLNDRNTDNLVGILLLSPCDMVGVFKKYHLNFEDLYKEARENVANREPRKLLNTQIWDWYTLSSQTFLSLFEEKSPVDNLPVHRPDDPFEKLAKIDLPILCIMGEYDDVGINNLEEDMNLISLKATNCPAFTKKFIPKASHVYDVQELQLATEIRGWINNLKLI